MATYNRYHTDLKIAASVGQLPADIAAAIPASTLHNLKGFDPSSLFAAEHRFPITKELLAEFAASKAAVATFRAALRIKNVMIAALSKGRSIVTALSKVKQSVLRVFGQAKRKVGKIQALRMLGLTSNRMTRWMTERVCPVSLPSLCLRTHPGQLASGEIEAIKKSVANEAVNGWPLVSIYWKSVRDGVLSFGLGTFYKYARLLGITRSKGRCRRKDHLVGVRAERPNEIWHADITVFTTLDHIKSYICLVVDNFSRRILAWAVSRYVSGKTHIEAVREAVFRFLPNKDQPDQELTRLITDGGPENVADPSLPLVKQVAGVDIHFSNSLVESVNRVVKYQSLYLRDIANHEALIRHLEHWIPVYNNERPHSAVAPLTPQEAHEGYSIDRAAITERIKAARTDRIAANRAAACPICGPSATGGGDQTP